MRSTVRSPVASFGCTCRATPELEQPLKGPGHVCLVEQRHQFVPQAGTGEIADQAHLHTRLRQGARLLVHAERVAVLVADGPEDAGGILDETQVVQHADDPVVQVAEAAEEVEHLAQILAFQRDRPWR